MWGLKMVRAHFVLWPHWWHWPWFLPLEFLEVVWVLFVIRTSHSAFSTIPYLKRFPIHSFSFKKILITLSLFLPFYIKNSSRYSSGSVRLGLIVLFYDLSTCLTQSRYSINIGQLIVWGNTSQDKMSSTALPRIIWGVGHNSKVFLWLLYFKVLLYPVAIVKAKITSCYNHEYRLLLY